jgi:hypothetical protein
VQATLTSDTSFDSDTAIRDDEMENVLRQITSSHDGFTQDPKDVEFTLPAEPLENDARLSFLLELRDDDFNHWLWA